MGMEESIRGLAGLSGGEGGAEAPTSPYQVRGRLRPFPVREKGRRWIPVFTGMTKRGAGMTKRGAGTTKRGAGMTEGG